jgi:hypothetical protein
MFSHWRCLINAVSIGQLKLSQNHMSGYATYRDLAGWSEHNFRFADNPLTTSLPGSSVFLMAVAHLDLRPIVLVC